jgi:hypothetical protein
MTPSSPVEVRQEGTQHPEKLMKTKAKEGRQAHPSKSGGKERKGRSDPRPGDPGRRKHFHYPERVPADSHDPPGEHVAHLSKPESTTPQKKHVEEPIDVSSVAGIAAPTKNRGYPKPEILRGNRISDALERSRMKGGLLYIGGTSPPSSNPVPPSSPLSPTSADSFGNSDPPVEGGKHRKKLKRGDTKSGIGKGKKEEHEGSLGVKKSKEDRRSGELRFGPLKFSEPGKSADSKNPIKSAESVPESLRKPPETSPAEVKDCATGELAREFEMLSEKIFQKNACTFLKARREEFSELNQVNHRCLQIKHPELHSGILPFLKN